MLQSTWHPEMSSSVRPNPGLGLETKLEKKTVDKDGDTSCDFISSKDVQKLLTCSDDVGINGCTQNKPHRHAVCANFIFRGFGPWCQSLENRTSVRCTSFSSQPSSVHNGSVNAAIREVKLQARLGRRDGCAVPANKGRRSTVARTETGLTRQPPSHRNAKADDDGRGSPYVFRHHENISDFIKDYRLHHTVGGVSSTRVKNSVTRSCSEVPEVPEPYFLKSRQPCLVHSVWNYDLSSTDLDPLIGNRMQSAEKNRAVPNLAPVREKKAEVKPKNSPKTTEAGQPKAHRTSKHQLPPSSLGPIHTDSARAEENEQLSLTNRLAQRTPLASLVASGTSSISQLLPVTRSSMLDPKSTLAPHASFPSLDEVALTQRSWSKVARRNRREMEVRFKYTNRRQGSLSDVPQKSLLGKNSRSIRQEKRKYDSGRIGQTQQEQTAGGVAESDDNNSSLNMGDQDPYLVKSESGHLTPSCPSSDRSALPEIVKNAKDGEQERQHLAALSLARVLLGADARLAFSVDTTRVAAAAHAAEVSPHDWKNALKRSAWGTCEHTQMTGHGKSHHQLPSLVGKVHDWLRLRDCLGLEEPRPPPMFGSQTAATSSGEACVLASELTLACAGVWKGGVGGRNGVMRALPEVPKECAVSEGTRDRQTPEEEADSATLVTCENNGREARGLPVPSLTGTAQAAGADVGEKPWLVHGCTELLPENLSVRRRTVTCVSLSSTAEDSRRQKTDSSGALLAASGRRTAGGRGPKGRRHPPPQRPHCNPATSLVGDPVACCDRRQRGQRWHCSQDACAVGLFSEPLVTRGCACAVAAGDKARRQGDLWVSDMTQKPAAGLTI